MFDLNAGCSGFIYSLEVATAMIRSGAYQKVLVIGSERITWFLNWSNRDTAVLFGDGAGAVVVEPSDRNPVCCMHISAAKVRPPDALQIPNFGTAGNRFVENYAAFGVQFDGREIFRRAVKGMTHETEIVLDKLGLTKADIDRIIPHQANLRIIESLAKHLSVDMSQVEVNIQNYGNTSAATIPVALTEALEAGRIKAGDRILLAAFGAGLTRAAGLLRWGERTVPLKQSDAELPPCEQTALEILAVILSNSHFSPDLPYWQDYLPFLRPACRPGIPFLLATECNTARRLTFRRGTGYPVRRQRQLKDDDYEQRIFTTGQVSTRRAKAGTICSTPWYGCASRVSKPR